MNQTTLRFCTHGNAHILNLIPSCSFIHLALMTSSRNSLVALLQALCAHSKFTFEISVLLTIFFACVQAFVSNKYLSSATPNQAPVPGCRHSSCVLIIHVCFCVCASVCACENVYVK